MPSWEYPAEEKRVRGVFYLNTFIPTLFQQPKGIIMQEPLKVKIDVSVSDASGKVVYDGSHEWSGMSEFEEVMLLSTLQNAVTELGREKALAKKK